MNLIIDGNNLLFRSFSIYKTKIKTNNYKDFLSIFLKSLRSYTQIFSPKKIYCVWDKKMIEGFSNYRQDLLEGKYKATRDSEAFKTVFDNCDELISILKTLGVCNIFPNKMEGDDIIGWLCNNLSGRSVIVSVDKDMYQLISGRVKVYSPIKKITIDLNNFEECTNLKTPNQYMWFRVFTGDNSDNISGVYKFGIKKFQKLIYQKQWDYTIESLESHGFTPDEIKIVSRNYKLMNLQFGYSFYLEEVEEYKKQF
jgi:5'-3' exonuclease